MKRKSPTSTAAELQKIPNIGPAMADDLIRLGITRADDLVDRDPDELYDELCRIDGVRHDPCVLDTFAAAVHFARGGGARPWWTFTPERKARDAARHMGSSDTDRQRARAG